MDPKNEKQGQKQESSRVSEEMFKLMSAGGERLSHGQKHNEEAVALYINELADWLLLTNDPRIAPAGDRDSCLAVLAQSASSFNMFMARLVTEGLDASHWRQHLNEFVGKPAPAL